MHCRTSPPCLILSMLICTTSKQKSYSLDSHPRTPLTCSFILPTSLPLLTHTIAQNAKSVGNEPHQIIVPSVPSQVFTKSQRPQHEISRGHCITSNPHNSVVLIASLLPRSSIFIQASNITLKNESSPNLRRKNKSSRDVNSSSLQ